MANSKHRKSFDPDAFLARIGAGRRTDNHPEGDTVFSQGDPCDAIYYIQEGEVKITVVSEEGKEAVVAIMGAHQFFGEASLTGGALRLATATALTPSVIVRLEKSAMQRVLHEEPRFAAKFIKHLLARAGRTEADLVDQLFNSSEKRLARLLLLLANYGKESAPEPIIAQISQETLAEMIGTTRSRVSHFMNKFRRLGLIEYNGRIIVHASLLNAVLHDNPHIKRESSPHRGELS